MKRLTSSKESKSPFTVSLSPLRINSAGTFQGKATHPSDQPGKARKRLLGFWREPGLVSISRRGGPRTQVASSLLPTTYHQKCTVQPLVHCGPQKTSGCSRWVSARCVSAAKAIMTFLYKVWATGSMPCLPLIYEVSHLNQPCTFPF